MRYAPPPSLLAAGGGFGVADMHLVPGFLPPASADALQRWLCANACWQTERVRLFGREHVAPRLVAWYGEAGVAYRYSGAVRVARGWPGPLRCLARRLGRAVGWRFDYVLATRYRDGRDCLGWHADDERELGAAPVIASVSLGAERMFRVRPRHGGRSVGQPLGHGSLLLMWGESQQRCKHSVPRTARDVGERLNLSFRRLREVYPPQESDAQP